MSTAIATNNNTTVLNDVNVNELFKACKFTSEVPKWSIITPGIAFHGMILSEATHLDPAKVNGKGRAINHLINQVLRDFEEGANFGEFGHDDHNDPWAASPIVSGQLVQLGIKSGKIGIHGATEAKSILDLTNATLVVNRYKQ